MDISSTCSVLVSVEAIHLHFLILQANFCPSVVIVVYVLEGELRAVIRISTDRKAAANSVSAKFVT